MFCTNCVIDLDYNTNYCTGCGQEANMESSDDNSDFTDDTFEDSEEEVLKYYFFRGFTYEEILLFLAKRHHCTISYSTLLRRLKKYCLMRRGVTNKDSFENTFLQVQRHIAELINRPSSSMGYRTLWHALELEGICVPRVIVQDLLKEMDPEGAELWKRHRLKRRAYHNPGPNYSWHIDGYDKLKCWGFPIHRAIDGYSRRILWLCVTHSNNSPNQIASFYAGVVLEQGGCPVQLVTDSGAENGTAAALQSYFRDNSEAHRYVPFPRNIVTEFEQNFSS
ncbi:RNA-directed DNA polymerase from mobile element jockey [Paramuricea clavata]|uniref:RNA-directed DNA polymerase from mobile element jockey n=1 Tax=Paramuricea clavata TaxID=317549 RepID=A0A6S7FMQ8_PARCT|nr:RNA-directed DNA polymerase from mobile element jockey [Paramuricea clavata]